VTGISPRPGPATVETAVAMLEALGTEMEAIGWPARLDMTAGRPPSLRVANPAAAALAEQIYAAPRHDGFCYWWSWAEPIARHPAEAAALISRALRTNPEFT
jgi:hypothetical protein